MSRILRPGSRGSPSVYSNDNGSIYGGADRHDGGVYYESPVSLVYRLSLPQGARFSNEEAQAQIEQNHRKRQSRCTLYMLSDRFRVEKRSGIGREPFRNELTYGEIIDCEAGLSRPEYTVLSVQTTRAARYYEVYKFPSPIKASQFVSTIQRVIRSSDGRTLSNEPVLRQKVFMRGDRRARSIVSLGPSEYDDDVGSRYSVGSEDYHSIAPSYASSNYLRAPQQYGAAPPSMSNIQGSPGVSFISYHPVAGPVESTIGPVYLFSSNNPDDPLNLSSTNRPISGYGSNATLMNDRPRSGLGSYSTLY